jgi:hypothetical protein
MTRHHRGWHFTTWLLLGPVCWLAIVYLLIQRWSTQP